MNSIAIFVCVLIAVSPSGLAGSLPQATPPKGAIVSSAPASEITPPPPGYRFPNGQTFVYSVEWHFFTAGTTSVKTEPAGGAQQVSATADSSGWVNALYSVHDRAQALVDPRSLCSQRVSKHTEEGSRRRETEIHFDYPRGKAVLDEKNLKTGELKHEENDIPECVTDVFSGFYYLASLPLQPGSTYTFPTNDGGKTADIKAQVEAREQIKVPAGTFQTVRVQAEPISGALKGRGRIWVWFSDDNHIAVQMRSKLGWGTLVFKLQKIEK
jgi:hypothetical protein